MSAETETIAVVTFGCRLNSVGSEAMGRAALEAGGRDLIIINTCAVTRKPRGKRAALCVAWLARPPMPAWL